MKTASVLSGYLLKTIVVLGLLVAAALVGIGVAGFVAYHQVSGHTTQTHPTPRATVPAEEVVVPRTVSLSSIETWEGQAIMMDVSASLAANRFIAAAGSSEQPQFSHADYQPDARGASANAGDVPPSLEPSSPERMPAALPSQLTLSDPGSRYIVNPNTGLIVGIDGTAGAQAEARQQNEEQQREAAIAARREREARAALPVDAPVVSGLPAGKPEMYPAIRRAEPVDAPTAVANGASTPRGFSAEAELSDDRPVFRAQPVTISQPVRTQRRVFALP